MGTERCLPEQKIPVIQNRVNSRIDHILLSSSPAKLTQGHQEVFKLFNTRSGDSQGALFTKQLKYNNNLCGSSSKLFI